MLLINLQKCVGMARNFRTSDEGSDPMMVRVETVKRTIAVIPADKSSIDKMAQDKNIGTHNPVRFILK